MSRELLLDLTLAPVPRCVGSDEWPRRNRGGRAECQICGRRFAPKIDGTVRRHTEAPRYLPVTTVDNTD